jgi:hypothetical protein
MRKTISLVMFLAISMVSMDVMAQRLTDSGYRTVGYIKQDGTIQDASYRTTGYIKSDGRVQDSSYRTVGYIKSDGTVQDASYRVIGHVKGIPMEWAALYFFFR